MKRTYKKLFLGILFDAIGMLSFIVPFFGEFSDVIWAPLAAWLMTKMYKSKGGKIAAALTFIEEILPGLDFIPSFTIMWLVTYILPGKDDPKRLIPIRVRS
ncbi:hypothetical protein ACG2LH_13315 [Zhouia sp. PK063]|uniref:hypothetical protein n=1 Tax=Zhouia sp. PK063 TaxID=3373602 RepID=UPI0037A46930